MQGRQSKDCEEETQRGASSADGGRLGEAGESWNILHTSRCRMANCLKAIRTEAALSSCSRSYLIIISIVLVTDHCGHFNRWCPRHRQKPGDSINPIFCTPFSSVKENATKLRILNAECRLECDRQREGHR